MHLFDLFQISRDKKSVHFLSMNIVIKSTKHQVVEKKSLFSSVQIVSEALQ